MVGIIFLIVIFGLISGVLAIQIANESTLVLRAKQLLYLNQPYSKKLLALGKFKSWWSLTPTFFIILLPLVSIFVLMLKLHHFLSELLDCPYCTSYHIMWMICFFYMGLPIITSLVLGPLGILGVYIIEKIRA